MNKLINGDCLEEISKLKDNSVDLVITDPPYLIGTVGGPFAQSRDFYNEIGNMASGFDSTILDLMVQKMKKINIYIFCSQKQIPILQVFNSFFSCFKICII